MKTKLPKKITLSKAKEKAWKNFSKYIRLKYCAGGEETFCYTCGKVGNYKTMQAGHGIAGRTNSILFQEDIVRVQCPKCNIFQHGALDVFVPKLIEEIGSERFNFLLRMKHVPLKYTVQDYLDIAEEYKKKLENL